MRQGILGGTFDPVHNGHLDVATAGRMALALDRVWFLPCGMPPHRDTPSASAEHRLAMVKEAVNALAAFAVSEDEIESTNPSHTDDTLARWTERASPASLVFLVGADAFGGIRAWRHFPALLDRCHFGVVSRPGHPVTSLERLLPELASRMRPASATLPTKPSILLIDAQTADVSSSGVRRKVEAGLSIADDVPPAVDAYIRKHGLYRREETSHA